MWTLNVQSDANSQADIDAEIQDGLWKWNLHHIMDKNFQSLMKKSLSQTLVDNLRKEPIVPEPGSSQNDRIEELVSKSLDTAIRALESERPERPRSSGASTDSRETIKAGKPSKPWEDRGLKVPASSRKCVDNDALDQRSPELSDLSWSKTVSVDSGYYSGTHSLSSSLGMNDYPAGTPFAISTAGIGSAWPDSATHFSMDNEQHDQGWSQPDYLQDLKMPGNDSVLSMSPMLSAEGASGDHQIIFPDMAPRLGNLPPSQFPPFAPDDSNFDFSSFTPSNSSYYAMMEDLEE